MSFSALHARSRSRYFAAAWALGLGVVCYLASPRMLAASTGRAVVGERAPAFVLERPGGGEFTRASFPRRPMVLNVYASWCASCRLEERALVRAYRAYGHRVTFLGVDEQEAERTAVNYARSMGVAYPIALDDGQFAATYGTSKIPETVFIDARGIVRAIRLGSMSAAEFASALATVMPSSESAT
jgi:thiol-disulfide isomerase/thioredoxin